MKLSDTVKLMASESFRDRLMAEYWQTKIRYDKLHRYAVQCEAGTTPFASPSELEMMKKQKAAMGQYLYTLEVRAEGLGIDLFECIQ